MVLLANTLSTSTLNTAIHRMTTHPQVRAIGPCLGLETLIQAVPLLVIPQADQRV